MRLKSHETKPKCTSSNPSVCWCVNRKNQGTVIKGQFSLDGEILQYHQVLKQGDDFHRAWHNWGKFNGRSSGSQNGGTLVPYKAIFWEYSLKFRPYIGLIYGRYIQFRFLKWPMITWDNPVVFEVPTAETSTDGTQRSHSFGEMCARDLFLN